MFNRAVTVGFCLIALCITRAAAAPDIFLLRDTDILQLIDQNADGDYLDALEQRTYAQNLPCTNDAFVGNQNQIYSACGAMILILEDTNQDGDVFDANEMRIFATLTNPAPLPLPAINDLIMLPNGNLLASDPVAGVIFRISDLNGDGDALDNNEALSIANSLTQPNGLTRLPDGRVIVSQALAATPARVLEDRNQDGDYFDFAENISYVENQPTGLSIVTVDSRKQRHLRPGQSDVVTYHDVNADGDALDTNETLTYASSLDQPARMARAAATDTLYVFLNNNSRELISLRDLNADGDALDVNEQVVVATGVGDVNDIFVNEPITTCTNGDADGSGTITITDLSVFSRILVGAPAPTPVCPLDMNADGNVDGRDIQPFIAALVGP